MPKKKKKWPIVLAICLGVGALAVWGVSALISNLQQRIPENVLTATAQSGVIESTVVGTGTLGYAGADTISIPVGVDVTSIFYEAGDRVSSGDLLAAVDTKSCEVLMSETYAEIASVEEQMRSTSSEPEVLQITAPVSGKVETLLVHDGSQVLDTLAADGSLLTISPGARMGAEISCDTPPTPGQRITLRFPDGTTKSASVQSVEEDSYTVTVAAPDAEAGTPVEASNASGEALGSGVLKALDAVTVVAPAGTVENVKVAPGASVEAGDVLFSVQCAEPPAQYQQLLQQREELTERYDALSTLVKDGGLVSPITGTVISSLIEEGQTGSTDVSDAYSSFSMSPQDAMNAFGMGMGMSRDRMTQEVVTENLGIGQGGENIMLTEEDTGGPPSDSVPTSAPETPDPTAAPTQPSEPTESSAPTMQPEPTTAPTAVPPTAEPSVEISLAIPRITVPLIPPIPGLPLQTHIDMLPLYQGEVTWTPEDEDAAFSTVYTAHISLRALNHFYFEPDCAVTILGADAANVSVQTQEDTSVLTFDATYAKTMNSLSLPDIDWNALKSLLGGASMDLNSLGKLLSSGLLPSSALSFDPSALYASAGIDPSSMYDTSGFGSALPGGAGAYDLSPYETAAYTIASTDKMELTIEINQMDILAVHPDMDCRITVDALEGKEYKGVVKEVAAAGNTSGTYTVVIDVDAADGMLSGMTASAVITTSVLESPISIPVAAVQEDGNRTFVYTTYTDGTFGGEKDIVTGVSNGTSVEISEGLSTGETIYYPGEDFMSQMMRMMQGTGSAGEPEISAVQTQEP